MAKIETKDGLYYHCDKPMEFRRERATNDEPLEFDAQGEFVCAVCEHSEVAVDDDDQIMPESLA